MLIFSACLAVKEGIDADEFQKWAWNFFQNPSKEYNEGLVNEKASKANDKDKVSMRINAIRTEIDQLKA